ncbi:hypothetical protein [Streptomyces lydicus]|uniref:hypothetical protein n=1 Tax=Streptomyces lydicus TaxID=47763 RepID=UPI001581694A|nr:hypothetical protein [Streptomyces lydicus]
MLEAEVVAVVVGWLCGRAASPAGRALDGSLSAPEDAEEAVGAAVDAVVQRLDGDSAWERLQQEVAASGREKPSERTRQRVALAVEEAAEAEPELAEAITAAHARWQAACRARTVTASDSGVAVGGDLSVTASGAGAIAVGGSVTGSVAGNAPPTEPKGRDSSSPPIPGPQTS